MIDDRTAELINRALDGELSDAEQQEIDEQVKQSDEARRYLAGMTDVDAVLKNMPAEATPNDLHQRIVSNITLPGPKPAPVGATGWPASARFGLAAAATVLVALGVYQFGSDSITPADLDQMVGTMAPGNVVQLDTFTFESADVAGSASLERRNKALVLNIEIDSVNPVDIEIDFAGTSLEFEALAKNDNDMESFEYATQGIRARSRGRQRFAVLLNRNDAATDKDGAIRLEYSSGGSLIHQGTLVPRW